MKQEGSKAGRARIREDGYRDQRFSSTSSRPNSITRYPASARSIAPAAVGCNRPLKCRSAKNFPEERPVAHRLDRPISISRWASRGPRPIWFTARIDHRNLGRLRCRETLVFRTPELQTLTARIQSVAVDETGRFSERAQERPRDACVEPRALNVGRDQFQRQRASRGVTPRAMPTRVRADKVRRRREPARLSAARSGRDPSAQRPQVTDRALSGVANGGMRRDVRRRRSGLCPPAAGSSATARSIARVKR